jgi:hypothetical protein
LVSCRGIEANPEKIKTIEAMRPPARIKEVQKLTGCLAALNRFISRLAERALPFFKLLRKFGPFVWTDDAEEAFRELKRYLTSPPIVVAPEPGEPLLLYIAATAEAMSMVMVAEQPDPLVSQHKLERWRPGGMVWNGSAPYGSTQHWGGSGNEVMIASTPTTSTTQQPPTRICGAWGNQ